MGGWAGVDRYAYLPPIWNEFLQLTDSDDHRIMLENKMSTWFGQRRKQLPRSEFFSKEQMKLITAAKFLLGGPIGVLESADQGVTYACLPRTLAAIQSIRKFEAAVQEA
jgi:hypothetical protein